MNSYDEIAESWYRLRHWTRFKPELEEMASRWGSGKLLNVGCAHGPDFLPFKDQFELWGLDSSVSMINMAVKYAGKFNLDVRLLVADAVGLPFRDSAFDCAISVAAYHHIKGKKEQRIAFSELRRVLKPDAEAFITVWNRWQREFWNKGKQVMVPWKTNAGEIMRYYYLFTYPEIEHQLKSAGFKVLKAYPESGYKKKLKYFSRNICLLVKVD
ncbi:MAG: class I SAM-dependent methyltransferase [Dehalococcoidia bacterium]